MAIPSSSVSLPSLIGGRYGSSDDSTISSSGASSLANDSYAQGSLSSINSDSLMSSANSSIKSAQSAPLPKTRYMLTSEFHNSSGGDRGAGGGGADATAYGSVRERNARRNKKLLMAGGLL